MDEKSCSRCVFYKNSPDMYELGQCEYPVPEYIKISLPGSNFVMVTAANNCQVYKTLTDVKEEMME